VNFKDLVKLVNGETVKVGKQQIYYDKDSECFVVEQYEYTTTESNEDMFSVFDGFENIEVAISTAKRIK